MNIAVDCVPAFADDAPFMHQHRADQGIGRYPAAAAVRKLNGALHESLVLHEAAKIALAGSAVAGFIFVA
jgi:hypothetical protein